MTAADTTEAQTRHIYTHWHAAITTGDIDALMSLYAPHARFESPSILVVLPELGSGILEGHAAIRDFFTVGFSKLSGTFTDWYRTGDFFSNGRQLTWEYPRATPSGDQTDLVEVMDIEAGLIVAHRVYWGWHGLRSLLSAAGPAHRQTA